MHIYVYICVYIYIIYVYVLPFWALVFLKYCAYWACTRTYTQICCIGCRVYNGEGPIVTWTHEGSTISESSWWCYQTILRFLMNQIDMRKETWLIFQYFSFAISFCRFNSICQSICMFLNDIIHKWACTLTHTNPYIYNYTYVYIYIYIQTYYTHTYVRTYIHFMYTSISVCKYSQRLHALHRSLVSSPAA